MKNVITYAVVLFIFSILQTVLIPEAGKVVGNIFLANFFYYFTIDFFLLLTIYFSFNRDFFHGLIWVMLLFFIESGLGYFWSGVQVTSLLTVFLLIQFLKMHFVFQNYYSIRVVTFLLCLTEHIIHIRMGTGLTWWGIIVDEFLFLFLSASIHAFFAPYLFQALTMFDAKTIYRFENQRTLFTTQIRSV